jgi:hypothetical protein
MADVTAGAGRAAQVAVRAIGLAVLSVLTWKLLARGFTLQGGTLLGFVGLVDLIFHEAGHIIFGFFGSFIAALGGSLNQVLVPAVCTVAFLRQRQVAAAAVMLFWTGENILGVATYVADGRAMRLPLYAEGLTHDWNFLLTRLGLLAWAEALGRLVFIAGALTLLAALGLLALDLARCWNAPVPPPVRLPP